MTNRRLITVSAVALAFASAAVPASARPFNLNANGSYVPAQTTATGQSAPAVVRLSPPARSFDWADVGIGFAGGLALALVALGGVLILSQGRRRRSRGSAPRTT